ncbi:MAG: zinc ribbon domain-containing protein [Planctomycetota bacterium]
MPIYEYCCDACGVFEAFRPISEFESPAICPDCGDSSPRVQSLPSLCKLDATVRKGMERNEKSRHEPVRHSTRDAELTAQVNAQPQIKSSSGPRPWMI